MPEFEREPLDLSAIPQKLQKHVQPDAPSKLKMMAARGMLPAPPEQMVKVLYQLHFDSDQKVAGAAKDSLADMPPNVLGPAIQNADHAGLLDWVGTVRADSSEIGTIVVRNQATDDQTVARLAEKADSQLADVIATNQVRILRTPKIIEGLYKNTAVSSATIDSLIELAQRNNVELKGLPGLSDALKTGQDLFGDKGADDESFSALLQQESERVEKEEEKRRMLEEAGEKLTRSQREKLRQELDLGPDEEEEEGDEFDELDDGSGARGNLYAQLNDMSIAQKIRLATVGSREAIKILVRDQNKLVHMAAIKSPRIKPADIAKFAGNKSLPDNVIEYIANNRDWTRKYDVVKNLVNNPKTPLKDTMKFLKHLRQNDLRDVMRSRNVPHQVSRAAKSLMRKRAGT
jgi:hypothetical protein